MEPNREYQDSEHEESISEEKSKEAEVRYENDIGKQEGFEDSKKEPIRSTKENNRGARGKSKTSKRNMRKKPKAKMNPWLVALSIICGCIVFVVVWSNILSMTFSGASMNLVSESLGNSIDVIYVEGTIGSGQVGYNHEWTLGQIDYLMESDDNKAILLYVNSPGGGVYESDELYLKLKEYKEVTKRPVYAYMAQTAASGGLYVCMAADKIYANRMTMTGSIGVIMSMTDTTGLQELIGVKTDNVVSGKNKAMGNPLTDEQREIVQSMVNETYEIFVGIVSEARGLSLEKTKEIADGRIYSALQAKELGLIDEIGLVDDALSDLRLTYDLQDCEIYHNMAPVDKWQTLFGGMAKVTNGLLGGEFSAMQDYIKSNETAKLMYYYGN